MELFQATSCYALGNGVWARVWQDQWINCLRVDEIAPNPVAMVPLHKVKEHPVRMALMGLGYWIVGLIWERR